MATNKNLVPLEDFLYYEILFSFPAFARIEASQCYQSSACFLVPF